jgi:predicted CXXCH cytochrome family protein
MRIGHGAWLAGALLLPCLDAQDHAGQPVPKYVTGDECLFCHRVKVADKWQQNPHALTVHPRAEETYEENLPPDAESILGSHPPNRGLKEDGYGKFDLLSHDGKSWDREAFALRCAGCHTTAVDPKTHTFSASSLDCYACHGVVPQNHPNDISLVWFSTKHTREPKQILSICGQCHLRGGKSKSSGLPYPNNFVAGDDLFHDFQVDFAKADDSNLNWGDRHIYRNARDVVVNGGKDTCITCHNVHGDNARKHRLVLTSEVCLDCHYAEGPKKKTRDNNRQSDVCEY